MISADTTLLHLLDAHPELVEELARHHAHFAQLRDATTRRLVAPRVTVAQAAAMAGVPLDELLAALRRAAGEPAGTPGGDERGAPPPAREPKPAALAARPDAALVHLDVREDVRRGAEPFARIMAAVKALGAEQALVLRAPFEPIPLYDVLGRQGLAHWTECRAPDDWSVWFYRAPAGAPRAAAAAPPAAPAPVVLDVRGLEPPQPMVRVLLELDRLVPGQRLEIVHDRRPTLLYPLLEERGFAHATDEPAPGVVRIRVERRGGAR